MLKDDRMMGMLTFVVIMVAVGTFVQRAEFFQRLFGTAAPEPVLNADVAEARVGQPALIDVLANDTGAEPAALTIAAPPDCGSASTRSGKILYRATPDCLGAQRLRYALGADGPSTELRITVRPADTPNGPLTTVIRPGVPETTVSAPAEAEPGAEASAAANGAGSQGGTGRAATEPAAAGSSEMSARTVPEPPETAESGPAELTANRTGPEAAAASGDTSSASTGEALPGPTAPRPTAPSAITPGAAEPARAAKCNFPPTLTVVEKPSAMTEVAVDSPCDRDVVAVLAYDGLRFAIPLNFRGAGSLEVPGFQRATEATITLERAGEMRFNLPFQGIERIDRVAIAWEEPAALALNAFEFGARPGAQGHLTPDMPRSFDAVRREGGGWLASYEPEDGKGQRIDVYSFWRRHGGPSGVVRLALDPGAGAMAGSCGAHPGEPAGRAAGGADYVVLRAIGGRVERSRLGRVAPLDCTVLAGGARRYIENAVDDLIVRRR